MADILADFEKIKQAKLEIGPLLDSIAQCEDLIRQCLTPDMHPEARSQIENVLQLVAERKTEFITAYDEEMPAMRKSLHESLDTTAEQMQAMEADIKKSQDILDNSPPLPDHSNDPSKNPFHPDNLVSSVPAGLPLLPVTTDLPLSEGAELKKHILSLRTDSQSGPSPGSRVSGNIWENWQKPGS
jgi:hypothetical protein